VRVRDGVVHSFVAGFAVSDDLTGPFVDVSAYGSHFCGILKSNGSLQCSGTNTYGQSPPLLAGPFIGVAVGAEFTCALRQDQQIVCIGANTFVTQIGDRNVKVEDGHRSDAEEGGER
jgi:alpha-tubulin suppressor-like RCC1 family protein